LLFIRNLNFQKETPDPKGDGSGVKREEGFNVEDDKIYLKDADRSIL